MYINAELQRSLPKCSQISHQIGNISSATGPILLVPGPFESSLKSLLGNCIVVPKALVHIIPLSVFLNKRRLCRPNSDYLTSSCINHHEIWCHLEEHEGYY